MDSTYYTMAEEGVVIASPAGAESVTQWLFQVDQRLSPEGFQLLKVLYLNTLPFRSLSDDVQQSSALLGDDNCFTLEQHHDGDIKHVQEAARMPPLNSLLLFIHRLRVLVPPASAVLSVRKGVGAQECLDRLPHSLSTLSSPRVTLSQESKMLECLVKTYINLTSRQRGTLMRNLGQKLGTHAENLSVYQLFGVLFTTYKSKMEDAVAMFGDALQQVKSPSSCVELEENLSSCGIPHKAIEIPDEDEVDEEVEREVQPLLEEYGKKQEQKQEQKMRRITQKAAKVCLCYCVPIILGLLGFAIGMAILSTLIPPTEETTTVETSDKYQIHCPSSEGFFPSQPIRIWKFNTFWHKLVTAAQEADDDNYRPLTAHLFLIPDDQIRVYRKKVLCTCKDTRSCAYFDLEGLYLLKGSRINFSLNINFTDDGRFDLIICDNLPGFNQHSSTCLKNFSLSSQTNKQLATLNKTFIAPKDSYYYIKTSPTNAAMTAYEVHMDMLFLNSSDWKGLNEVAEFNEHESASITQSLYKGYGLTSMFAEIDYTIVATFPTKYNQGSTGQMKVIKYHRSLVYVIPAIAAVSFMLLGIAFVACVCICCHIIKKIIHNQQKGKELRNPINDHSSTT